MCTRLAGEWLLQRSKGQLYGGNAVREAPVALEHLSLGCTGMSRGWNILKAGMARKGQVVGWTIAKF